MVSWVPRLLDASSWTSSMMTYLTWVRCRCICEPGRMAWSVSGVVTSICGGWRACLRRVFISVSPCLISTVMPSCCAQKVRRLSISRFSALRGVMYMIWMPFVSGSGCWIRLLKMGRMTASVLPVPVGAMSRTFLPASISGNASVCGKVGSVKPSIASALRTGLARDSKTDVVGCISVELWGSDALTFVR